MTKYKIFYDNGAVTAFYYNTSYELKLYELYLDCFKYKFCPICTNKLHNFKNEGNYFSCNEHMFSITTLKEFIFTINDSKYYYNSAFGFILDSKDKTIEFKDLITDVDNLTLIIFYNNLKKYLTFQ